MKVGRLRRGIFPLCLAICSSWAVAQTKLECPPDWSQEGKVREFTPDTLFEYMNGNAEGYLIYGFQKMLGITCGHEGTQLHIDLSTIDSPTLAWGLYASNRDPREPVVSLGMGGQVLDNRAILAKGNEFIEFAVEPAGDHRALLTGLVEDWAERLPGETTPPAAIEWFPKQGLEQESIRLIPSSVLGVSQLRQGFVADYASGLRAFIVTETSVEAASKVMQELRERFEAESSSSEKIADESFQTSGRYLGEMCIFRKGREIAGAVRAKQPSDAAKLAASLAARLP